MKPTWSCHPSFRHLWISILNDKNINYIVHKESYVDDNIDIIDTYRTQMVMIETSRACRWYMWCRSSKSTQKSSSPRKKLWSPYLTQTLSPHRSTCACTIYVNWTSVCLDWSPPPQWQKVFQAWIEHGQLGQLGYHLFSCWWRVFPEWTNTTTVKKRGRQSSRKYSLSIQSVPSMGITRSIYRRRYTS